MFPDHDVFDAPDFRDTVFTNSRNAILYHDDFLRHRTGTHPENPQRLVVMKNALESHPVNKSLEWVEPRLCDESDVLRCHTSGHLEMLKRAAELACSAPDNLVWLDPDTPVSPDSFRAACRAVGACCQGVDMVLRQGFQSAWCLVRPPGHHATAERAMGFCLFNNAACAAEYARAVHKIERVMIVDYDLHHGNGTQDIFYGDRGVLYTSIHQSYHYPGTGHIDEIGSGEGRGYTVNFPVLAGGGDGEFALYMRQVVASIASQFKPQILIVSVGFDAHADDHLGALQLSSRQFGRIVTLLRAVASDLNIGIVYALEGGYSLEAQAESIVESLIASTAEKFDPAELPMPYRPSQSAQAGFESLRRALHGIWDI